MGFTRGITDIVVMRGMSFAGLALFHAQLLSTALTSSWLSISFFRRFASISSILPVCHAEVRVSGTSSSYELRRTFADFTIADGHVPIRQCGAFMTARSRGSYAAICARIDKSRCREHWCTRARRHHMGLFFIAA